MSFYELIGISLEDFIKNKLSKTDFSREQVEKAARQCLEFQEPYEFTIRNEVYQVSVDELAIYFGLASRVPRPKAEVVDEDHVSRDPIGMDDVPAEEVAPEPAIRRPGRRKKR